MRKLLGNKVDQENHSEKINNYYNEIKYEIPTQDHNYILDIDDSQVYEDIIAIHFKCAVCNCLLIRMTDGNFKFNDDFDGNMSYDIIDKNKFLTCKENIIKKIIQ